MGIDALVLGGLVMGGLNSAGSAYGAERTSESNEKINAQNMQLQREINAQNEALMREAWGRDDSAVIRRVNDLKRAGLSKTLAAGSAAAVSQPIKLEAPKMQQTDNHWAQAGQDIARGLTGGPGQMIALDAARAQADLTRTQEASTQEQIATEGFKQANYSANTAKALTDAGFKKEATRMVKKDADVYESTGIRPGDRGFLDKFQLQAPETVKAIKGAMHGLSEAQKGPYREMAKKLGIKLEE